MTPIKTVRVASPVSDENPHGYIVINADDLTEEHTLFEAEKPARKPQAKAKP